MSVVALGVPSVHRQASDPASPCPTEGPLVDTFGRVATDLRVSLTDLCNLRCTYCMPAEGLDWMPGEQKLDADELIRLLRLAVTRLGTTSVRFTGGEPLLQLDATLIEALHARDFEIAVETNGTLTPPAGIDWLCVSPKGDTSLAITAGDELKLVYPQAKAMPERFENLDFAYFMLQPMDGPDTVRNTEACIDYCRAHPRWRLSLQTHKVLGIP